MMIYDIGPAGVVDNGETKKLLKVTQWTRETSHDQLRLRRDVAHMQKIWSKKPWHSLFNQPSQKISPAIFLRLYRMVQ